MSNRFALVVGVSEYGDGFIPLKGCTLDAQAIESVLKDPEKGCFAVEKLENCDSSILKNSIERFFREKNRDDLLLFYFSGHGDLGRGGIQHQELHFCTSDSYKGEDKQLQESNAVSASFLIRQMLIGRCRKIVVILDCCYSGAIINELRKGNDDVDYSKLKAEGRAILASSSKDESSYQKPNELSLYTSYLIDGMMGSACSEESNWIVVRNLHDYIMKRSASQSPKPKIYADDTSYNLEVVLAPKQDPKLKYRDEFTNLYKDFIKKEYLDFKKLNSEDHPLYKTLLDSIRKTSNLEVNELQKIEIEIKKDQEYYLEGLREYAKTIREYKGNKLDIDQSQRSFLEKLRIHKGLSKEDAENVEKKVDKQIRARLEEIKKENLRLKNNPIYRLFSEEYCSLYDLDKFLFEQKFKEADKETFHVLLKILGIDKQGYIASSNILDIPCEILRAIDMLWKYHSNGRFGFSVQQSIYKGSTDVIDFKRRLNWNTYKDLNFSISAVMGHLPVGQLGKAADYGYLHAAEKLYGYWGYQTSSTSTGGITNYTDHFYPMNNKLETCKKQKAKKGLWSW